MQSQTLSHAHTKSGDDKDEDDHVPDGGRSRDPANAHHWRLSLYARRAGAVGPFRWLSVTAPVMRRADRRACRDLGGEKPVCPSHEPVDAWAERQAPRPL